MFARIGISMDYDKEETQGLCKVVDESSEKLILSRIFKRRLSDHILEYLKNGATM